MLQMKDESSSTDFKNVVWDFNTIHRPISTTQGYNSQMVYSIANHLFCNRDSNFWAF